MLSISNMSFMGIVSAREYPVSGGLPEHFRHPYDKENYLLLFKELRQQLSNSNRTKDRSYLLTVPWVLWFSFSLERIVLRRFVWWFRTGAGTERISDMDLAGMSKYYLDWINVMTYDFRGHCRENSRMWRSFLFIGIKNRWLNNADCHNDGAPISVDRLAPSIDVPSPDSLLRHDPTANHLRKQSSHPPALFFSVSFFRQLEFGWLSYISIDCIISIGKRTGDK